MLNVIRLLNILHMVLGPSSTCTSLKRKHCLNFAKHVKNWQSIAINIITVSLCLDLVSNATQAKMTSA